MPSKPLAVVIDDDASCADALAFTLTDWGADVLVATSALEALAALGERASSVRWILTDYHLGELDGIAGVVPLRAAAPSARVLVLSGSLRGRHAKSKAAKAGFQLIAKPAPADLILAWIEEE